MVQVAHPYAVNPPDLVAIARPDPATGRAQVVGRRRRLLGQPLLVEVIRKDHVRPVADVQPLADLHPLRREGLDLLEDRGGVDHHPVADDAIDPRPEDAGRQERELVRDPVGDNRVPRVRPALVPDDRVVLVAQQIHDLSLGFVTPLKPHHACRSHGKPSPISFALAWDRKANSVPLAVDGVNCVDWANRSARPGKRRARPPGYRPSRSGKRRP